MSSDIIYYDINIASPTGSSVRAVYDETRTQNIINDASEYYMAIARFSVDASAIPLFVCPVIPNPLNPLDFNYTPYNLFFTYYDGVTNFGGNSQLIYIPNVQTQQPNPPTVSTQDISGFYYYVYYYQTFIQMTNNAIAEAFSRLVTLVPILAGTPIPYVQYEASSNSVSLIVPNNPLYITAYNTLNTYQYTPAQFPDAASVGKIIFYMNSPLYKYYSLINSYSAQTPPISGFSPPNFSHLMIVTDNKNNYYYPPQNAANTVATQVPTSFIMPPPVATFPVTSSVNFTDAPLWLIFPQEGNAISTWNSLSSLVFLTSALPVQVENIPYTSVPSLQNGSQIGSASFLPILTDFIPDLTQAKDNRIQFTYYANPYRLVQLNWNIPIRRIDLQIFWQDKFQNLYPIYVSGNSLNSIKLVFIKKDLVKYNYRPIMYN